MGPLTHRNIKRRIMSNRSARSPSLVVTKIFFCRRAVDGTVAQLPREGEVTN
jgi:hypothetical protein